MVNKKRLRTIVRNFPENRQQMDRPARERRARPKSETIRSRWGRMTDELELLATVDMAMEDLRRAGKSVDLAGVKLIIREQPEWEAKLDRDIFSDPNGHSRAIKKCGTLFGPSE
jgi:hypothetical protein